MLLKILHIYIPNFIKKQKLKELFNLTAAAFQSEMPNIQGLSYQKLLIKYALFTKQLAESYLQSGKSVEAVKERLYNNTYILGQDLRKSLNIKTQKQAELALEIIYNLIGIEFQCNRLGEIEIRQCFFSKYYSSDICKLISSLDEGLAAGLTDGGSICFSHRITEGSSCCKGYFRRATK